MSSQFPFYNGWYFIKSGLIAWKWLVCGHHNWPSCHVTRKIDIIVGHNSNAVVCVTSWNHEAVFEWKYFPYYWPLRGVQGYFFSVNNLFNMQFSYRWFEHQWNLIWLNPNVNSLALTSKCWIQHHNSICNFLLCVYPYPSHNGGSVII